MKILLLDIKDLHYLAGLLEGEGNFIWHQTKRDRGRVRIQLGMTDKDVLDRVALIMQSKVTGPYGPYTTQKIPYWYTHCSGEKAVSIMKQLLPLMGSRRSNKIKALLIKWNTR